MFEGSLVVCREWSPKDSDTCFGGTVPFKPVLHGWDFLYIGPTYCLHGLVPPFLVPKNLGEMDSNKMKKGESPQSFCCTRCRPTFPIFLTFSYIIHLSALS